MNIQKITFPNAQGQRLSAKLEFPLFQRPVAYAIFAHCFTCNKNLSAVRHIAAALTYQGIAIMRFDFTGLGESEGDFADTNFSSNVGDLVAAADFLTQKFAPPKLLIGHSLGGAAVLFAANQIPSIQAVAAIAAPCSPSHVKHLFEDSLPEIERQEIARVNIGGRPFTIKKQLLEDIASNKMPDVLRAFNKKSLLVLHSPQDAIVDIEHAAMIYKHAYHPKSFISLNGADHLLSDKQDSLYAGRIIASWASRYMDIEELEKIPSDAQVVVRKGKEKFTSQIRAGKHCFQADEPLNYGGNDFGPPPYDLLLSSLGSCTAMTIGVYAENKQWQVDEIVVFLNYISEVVEQEDGRKMKKNRIQRELVIEGNLDERQRQRLLEIANKCPVHKTLKSELEISTQFR